MNSMSGWLEKVRALPKEHVDVLRLISEGKNDEEIGSAIGIPEAKVREIILAVGEELALGPFDDPQQERDSLGTIYRTYWSPEAAEEPQAEKPAKAREQGAGRKKLNGGGIVIEIPSDTIGIDVLTGLVPDAGMETESVSKSIQERRKQGFKPAFLVLSPSSVDPTATNFRLIFFERSEG